MEIAKLTASSTTGKIGDMMTTIATMVSVETVEIEPHRIEIMVISARIEPITTEITQIMDKANSQAIAMATGSTIINPI
jgi:hypothetical protein